jgi:hypothetical protein
LPTPPFSPPMKSIVLLICGTIEVVSGSRNPNRGRASYAHHFVALPVVPELGPECLKR